MQSAGSGASNISTELFMFVIAPHWDKPSKRSHALDWCRASDFDNRVTVRQSQT